MSGEGTITLIVFSLSSSAVLLVYSLVGARRTRVDRRLEDLQGRNDSDVPFAPSMAQFTQTTLPRMGTALMPADEEERTLLRTRLIHAGFYGRQAMAIFLGTKMLVMVGPTLIGLALGTMGLVPMRHAVVGGACLAVVGLVGPSFWL